MNCAFENVTTWNINGFRCFVTNFEITSFNKTITTINHEFRSIAAKENVTILIFSSQTVKFFPKGINKFFPNINRLDVDNCQLKKINKTDLEVFPELRELTLADNNIEVLEDDLFSENRELYYIWLSNNKIKFVGENTFASLKHLETLYLEHNLCISDKAWTSKSHVTNVIRHTKKQCSRPPIQVDLKDGNKNE
jgi:Leucine-rich repeat (LRR) protein